MATLRVAAVILLLLAAPSVAEAQTGKVWRIGWLQPVALLPTYADAFRQGLGELGYVEGKNIVIEYRWAEGTFELLPGLAAELVRLKVDVLVSTNTAAVQALKRATTTIPIVMLGIGDPVGSGLVTSLARPGGNITGITIIGRELNEARLGLLKQLVPRLSRVAFLGNAGNPFSMVSLKDTTDAGRALGVSIQALLVRGPEEFGQVVSAMLNERAEALIVAPDTMLLAEREKIAGFAATNRLPSISYDRAFADAGGLLAYGPNFSDLYRRYATYVDKILKGTKPTDLPVEQPTKFELVINMKTAKALGLRIPPSLLLRADQTIE
jgi:putative ABC transport system substrate-binding protein